MAMTQTPSSPPVLNLDTLVVRPRVTIDGHSYDLLHPDEFSIIDRMRVARQSLRIGELAKALITEASGLSAEEETEYVRLLDATCRAILLAPEAVHAKLREEHRVAITQVFTTLQLEAMRLRGAAAQTTETLPELDRETVTTARAKATGTRTSRASRGSTAATRSAG